MKEVKIDQVYRERDSRFTRYVKVLDVLADGAAVCRTVDKADGVEGWPRNRTTTIRTLQTRFELVKDVSE